MYGLWIRRHTEESSHFEDQDEPEESPLREVLKYPKALAIAFAGAVLNAIGFYVILTYLPTYLSEELGMAATPAFIASSVASAFYVGFALLTGMLSDRLGPPHDHAVRGRFYGRDYHSGLYASRRRRNPPRHYHSGLLGVACWRSTTASCPPSFPSSFPTHVRLSGFALTFNTANAVFGGTAPMIATWLIDVTGLQLAPAFYLVAAALVTGTAVLFASKKK